MSNPIRMIIPNTSNIHSNRYIQTLKKSLKIGIQSYLKSLFTNSLPYGSYFSLT